MRVCVCVCCAKQIETRTNNTTEMHDDRKTFQFKRGQPVNKHSKKQQKKNTHTQSSQAIPIPFSLHFFYSELLLCVRALQLRVVDDIHFTRKFTHHLQQFLVRDNQRPHRTTARHQRQDGRYDRMVTGVVQQQLRTEQ